jgi:ATP-dependent Lhr-like helicase
MPPPRRARTSSPRTATPRKRAARKVAPPPAPEERALGVDAWFESRGWTPFPFQREAWAAYARGESGLIHVPTGAGKSYSAYLGPL